MSFYIKFDNTACICSCVSKKSCRYVLGTLKSQYAKEF